jgi:predicted aminopeptidase
MEETRNPAPRSLPTWILALLTGVIGIAGLGWIAYDVLQRAQLMRPVATSASAVLAAREGELIRAVVRLRAADGANAWSADLLDKLDDTSYRQTASVIRVVLLDDTSIVMGGPADLRPGAVVQLSGNLNAERALRVRRVVILTEYVHVVPDR